ncbi:MAG: cysteine synthase A [Raoultibacter sp.]
MADEVSRAIGNTQLLKLEKFSKAVGACVYAKYEAANPGASIKDRAAKSMIDRAEAAGIISPENSVLIEPTSGNTGIAIAMIGAARGYRVVLAMPESMSRERRALLAAYGAQLVLTPAAQGMAGAVARAEELAAQTPGGWIVGQFTNADNPLAHQQHTAPEIEAALGGAPDYLITGVGTGGTITGCAHYFAERGAPTQCFAVEPADSPIISQTLAGAPLTPGPHGIQGIGANFIPAILDVEALAGALPVATADALEQARALATTEGLLVGISTGANLAAIRRFVAEHPEARGTNIVTMLVDTGERYISTPLFEGIA